jgi:ATP-dependent Zn protease
VREARRQARSAGRDITLQDLLAAIRGGAPELPAEVRRRFAYHEAGHAIAALTLGVFEPMAVSIGGTGGLAEIEPGGRVPQTRAHIEGILVFLLAGRAAEQLVFGETTAGAGGSADSDLARATSLALRLETIYGLGSQGLVWLGHEISERDLLRQGPLRTAVHQTLEKARTAALDLLRTHRRSLDALAGALFQEAYLDRDDIRAVLLANPLAADTAKPAPSGGAVPRPLRHHGAANPLVAEPNDCTAAVAGLG